MAISIGDRMPQLTLKTLRDGLPQDIGTDAVFDGKTVVLFAVPGAFTPGCSQTHLPGYVVHADDIKARGVDTIACVSVNDAFVMGAWGKAQNAEALLMLADADAALVKALGLGTGCVGFRFGIAVQTLLHGRQGRRGHPSERGARRRRHPREHRRTHARAARLSGAGRATPAVPAPSSQVLTDDHESRCR